MLSLPRQVRAVMFDLDGTLIDTMKGFADVAADVMYRRHGFDAAIGRQRYLETSGIPFRQQLEAIHPGHAENQAASDEFEVLKRVVCDHAVMTPETVDGLARLRGAGCNLIVSSNSAQYFVDEFQEREEFEFDLVLGFDADRGLAKGAPHVDKTCRMFGLSRDEVLFCGDSLKDGELAHACEIAFVARLGTFTAQEILRWNADAMFVHDIPALATLVQSRAAA
jgi:phosphoglycolate phosphatase-like HAD superfamily hydrolase